MWTVYLLRCSGGELYCGVAKDIGQRLRKHNAGKGAKYTRSRLPVILVYQEPQPDRSSAQRREAEIKRMAKADKEKLCLMYQKGASTSNPTKKGRGQPPFTQGNIL